MRPGPTVAATASIPPLSTPADTRASATTGVSSSTWARLAISGTTPPKRACRSTWLDTTEERMSRPPVTTAAAVSSHEVSMPRIVVPGSTSKSNTVMRPALGFAGPLGPRSRARSSCDTLPRRGAGHRRGDGIEPLSVRGEIDVVGPHHDRVLVGLGVVVLPHPGRREAERAVQLLGARVAHPDLEREPGAAALGGGSAQPQHEPCADPVA